MNATRVKGTRKSNKNRTKHSHAGFAGVVELAFIPLSSFEGIAGVMLSSAGFSASSSSGGFVASSVVCPGLVGTTNVKRVVVGGPITVLLYAQVLVGSCIFLYSRRTQF